MLEISWYCLAPITLLLREGKLIHIVEKSFLETCRGYRSVETFVLDIAVSGRDSWDYVDIQLINAHHLATVS